MKKKSITSIIRSKSKPLLQKVNDFVLNRKNSNRGHQRAHLIKGTDGEKIAANYLKKNGYKMVEKNYHCKFGEIDIIALDGDILAFVEVKTRGSKEHVPPEFTVTKHKQSKIKRSAIHYLGKYGITNRDCRFDIAAVIMGKGKSSITLYKNAFS